MSELSAKHKALNILRVLTAEKDCKIQNSPRPDLTGSQEVLAGKYLELATLLATQHVERKTVARLQSVDLVSRSVGHVPSPRGQHYHDNQVKSVRRKHRRVVASPESDHTPKIEENKIDATELNLDLEQSPKSLLHRKKVSFSDARLRVNADDYTSSSTDVSATEVIRSILRSPRKVLTGEVHPHPPVSVGRRVDKQRKLLKRELHNGKTKCSPKRTTQRSGSPSTGSQETSQTKEFHPSDNKLSSSSNPVVSSWLKEKNKIIWKQKRSERKKERKEQLAEQRVADEKLRRQAESEDKVTQWIKHKKDESFTKRQTKRKIQKDAKQREALQHIERVEESNKISPPTDSTTASGTQIKSMSAKSKSTKTPNTVPSTKENVSDNQRCFDEETRHHLVRNLETERLHTEEKRQRKEAEKRRKRLQREAQNTQSSSKATSKLTAETKYNSSFKTTADSNNCKRMPSSNPFKGLTYNDWLRQKQADHQKQAKEARKQEVGDPELDDLIPLLARRRIEQIKVRATHVDSGLRKSRSSPDLENDKTEKPRTLNGVRPYTWKPLTSSNENRKETKKPNLFTKSSQSDKKNTTSSKGANGTKQEMAASMPDVINFERPEPQGCEGTENSSCQSSVTSQSKETKKTDMDQSKPPNLTNTEHHSADGDGPIKHSKQSEKNDTPVKKVSSGAEAIFLTEHELNNI